VINREGKRPVTGWEEVCNEGVGYWVAGGLKGGRERERERGKKEGMEGGRDGRREGGVRKLAMERAWVGERIRLTVRIM